MGRLTTHVLDTAHGCPAAGMVVELHRTDGERALVVRVITNADGRCDTPLLADAQMVPGRYELVFFAGDYFAARNTPQDSPRFLDRVPLAFGIANPAAHYHVPLLVSPWSYSTYRGS